MSTASDQPNPQQIPPGVSHREYRQRLSHSAHPSPQIGQDMTETTPVETLKPRRSLKFGPAFWTITGILSLAINVILIVILLALSNQIFNLKAVLQTQLIDGLRSNFALMDQARIKTTIPVKAEVPAKFDLPLKTDTSVILQKDTLIRRARVTTLSTGGLSITNAPADIVLPAGTVLPIQLDLVVPVDQKIPVNLTVNVDIPLNQTDLHQPFTGLQKVVDPYYSLLDSLPGSMQEMMCGKKPSGLCKTLFPK